MAVRIVLSKDELLALEKLAWQERRRVGVQAALLVRETLIARGFLKVDGMTSIAVQPMQPSRREVSE